MSVPLLEQAAEQRKKAQAEASELRVKVQHLENAFRSLSAAGFGGLKTT